MGRALLDLRCGTVPKYRGPSKHSRRWSTLSVTCFAPRYRTLRWQPRPSKPVHQVFQSVGICDRPFVAGERKIDVWTKRLEDLDAAARVFRSPEMRLRGGRYSPARPMFGSCSDRPADSTASSSRRHEETCLSASHQDCPKYGACGLDASPGQCPAALPLGIRWWRAPFRARSEPGQSSARARWPCRVRRRPRCRARRTRVSARLSA